MNSGMSFKHFSDRKISAVKEAYQFKTIRIETLPAIKMCLLNLITEDHASLSKVKANPVHSFSKMLQMKSIHLLHSE